MKLYFELLKFGGYTFCYVCSKCNEGIETVKYSGGVRITDKEQAAIDGLKFSKIRRDLFPVPVGSWWGTRHLWFTTPWTV